VSIKFADILRLAYNVMKHFRLDLFLFLSLLASSISAHAFFVDNKQQDGEALLFGAHRLLDIRAPGNPGFRLTAHFRILDPKLGDVEGTYLEVWASPQQWRREINAGTYHQIEVGNETTRWALKGLTSESSRFQQVQVLFSHTELDLEKFKVKDVHDETNAGVRVRCVEIKSREQNDDSFCFDGASGTPLLTVLRFRGGSEIAHTYSDYAKLGSHSYPLRLRRIYDREALEATVTNLVLESSPQQSLFDPPGGSQEIPNCRKIEPPRPLKQPDPEYPRGETGSPTVVLFIIVGPDGRIREAKVARSGGGGFDAAALKAARGWIFQPAICSGSGKPVPVALNIEFSFKLY
jgi:TonB family protein